MTTFAVLQNNTVTNIIIAESKQIAEEVSRSECIESEVAGIGWVYDDKTGSFSNPAIAETNPEN